jgi:hypothetical protein
MPEKRTVKKGNASSKSAKVKNAVKIKGSFVFANKISVGWNKLLYLSLAWMAVIAGLLAVPNYNILLQPGNLFTRNEIPHLPTSNLFTHLPSAWLIWAGFIALVILWGFVPDTKDDAWDISPWTSRFFFWMFMVAGVYLRLENPRWPVGNFWDDHYYVISDIRNIIDFHQDFVLFPFGWREPFYPNFSALVWILMPWLTGSMAVLMSSTIIDMVAVWLFYLIGKELGGRRMGIILMGLGAICKTMIMMTRFVYGTDTCVLGGALAILFFLRVLKKPDVLHFVEWGLALGFGGYTYVPFRPWMPVMLGVVWLWVFSDKKERQLNGARFLMGPLLLMVWALVFLYKNSLLPDQNFFQIFVNPVVLNCLFLGIIWGYVKSFLDERKKGFTKLFGWATGAILTGIVMSPLLLHPNYSAHVSDISIFSPKFTAPGQGFAKLWENIGFTFGLFFGQVNHVSRLPALGDSLYEFLIPVCGLLGLSYFVAKPRWIPAYIVVLFLISLVPGVLSNGPHSFRYASCDLPLLLIGAWGLNRLWIVVRQVSQDRFIQMTFAVLLLAGWAWELGQNHKLIWEWLHQQADTSLIWDQTEKELPNHRVYLVEHGNPVFYTPGQNILTDGEEVYRMEDQNAIDLTPADTPKDLCVMVYGGDVVNQKKIEAEFPNIHWNSRRIILQGDTDTPFMFYAEVPFDQIPVKDKGLFFVQHVSPWSWMRRCYGHYGLGRGLILYEDRVAHWNEQPAPGDKMDAGHSMRVSGDWSVKVAGDYLLKMTTANTTWFFLDGRKIFNVPPDNIVVSAVKKVSLTPGVHHVELVTSFNWEHQVPKVTVIPPNLAAETPLDDYAAANQETSDSTSALKIR